MDITPTCESGNLKDVKAPLKRYKIDANLQDQNGQTVLHEAALVNNKEATKLLLEHFDVDVNLQNGWGRTPLHIAMKNKHGDIVKLILKHSDTGRSHLSTQKNHKEPL